jgi:Rieske Fe-S protein
MSYRRYDKKKCKEQKEHHSCKIGTWKVWTSNQEAKLENLKKEMQKNEVSVLEVSEVRWKEQGEIRSGDYTVYYSGCERDERGAEIVVLKIIVSSVIKKLFVMTESLLLS